MPVDSLLRVAVGPRFAAPLLDYLAPGEGPVPPIGTRVSVPLGTGRRTGIVLEHLDGSEVPAERLRPVLKALDAEPLWDPATLEVLRWAARYYCHPSGQVLAYALPQQLRRGAGLPPAAVLWRANGKPANEARELVARAPRQRQLLDKLIEAGRDGLEERALAALMPGWRRMVRALESKGLAESFAPASPDPADMLREKPLALSGEQAAAVNAMPMGQGYACHLLDGVTASGKTEVYLHLVEQVLASGRQCLLLAPEIGLTPQLAERLAARFRVPAAVLHSGLSDGERLDAWANARSGRARMVVGTRSAVFVPLPRTRPDRGGRGARSVLQATGRLPLPGPRPRRDARVQGRHPGRFGVGHAGARIFAERAKETLRAAAFDQKGDGRPPAAGPPRRS